MVVAIAFLFATLGQILPSAVSEQYSGASSRRRKRNLDGLSAIGFASWMKAEDKLCRRLP